MTKDVEEISIRTPETLGCCVVATALLQSVRKKFPDVRIVVYTQFPDLFPVF